MLVIPGWLSMEYPAFEIGEPKETFKGSISLTKDLTGSVMSWNCNKRGKLDIGLIYISYAQLEMKEENLSQISREKERH